MSDRFFEEHLRDVPIVAIFRGQSPEATVQLCENAWDAGIRLVEVPVQDEPALLSLGAAIAAGHKRGRLVGAGTITNLRMLDEVIQRGAAFTVSPGIATDVMSRSADLRIPHLPGVASASDIMLAERHGHNWVKAFPAAALASDWPKHMFGPFPGVRLVATGGVRTAHIDEYLRRGYSAVGIGTELAEPDAIASIRDREWSDPS